MTPPLSAAQLQPRVVIPDQLPWHGKILARCAHAIIQATARTVRFTLDSASAQRLAQAVQPQIFCVWHNRLALSLLLYNQYFRPLRPDRSLAAMVSASKDGALLARILEHFRTQPVRGSTSRRGPQAMLELTTWAERGYDLAITPDGPRGPRYQIQDGIVSLAQLTGLPIFPVSYALTRKIELKSWDRFQIPFPFSQCRVLFGEAVRVPHETSDAQREEWRLRLESEMRQITPEMQKTA